MRTCEDVREAVSAWLDGELDQELEAEALAHTSECDDCRSFLEICRAVSEDLRAELPPVPETLIPGVMKRVAEERQSAQTAAGSDNSSDRRRVRRRIAAWACAAACLALVIFAGPWNWRAGSAGPKADMYSKDAAAPAAAEPAEAPAEAVRDDAGTNGWDAAEQKSASYDESVYDTAEADFAEPAEEETAENAVLPEESARADSAPAAGTMGELPGDYAAVITVYGGLPDGVRELAAEEVSLPDGTAWLIPAERADDLLKTLEDAGSYEWLTGDEEASSWLLVRAGEN